MKTKSLIIIFFLSVILSTELKAGIEDVCGTTSGSSAPYIPTSGNLKVLVIFAQFQDDPDISDNGWDRDSYPTWANTFVNSSTGGNYPWNNLSHYYNEMSNGTFQVIGDVYDNLVITNYPQSHYSSIGEANREIIMEVDPTVDFSSYDNLNGSSWGSDGFVDFIYIIYRNVTGSSLMDYSGKAHLNVSSTINVDGGKYVINTSTGPGGGVQQRGGYNGRDYTLYVAAHELGHYLFGSGHIDYASNLCLMSNLPVWNSSRGMHSWERHKLGWISYTDKTTDGTVTMSDYMTADQVYHVPVSSSEYFLIENRLKQSSHDKAGGTGFYYYRITGATAFPPAIDVLCADGNWNFSINTSTQTLTRTTQNVTGKNEMNFRQSAGGVTYACYTPKYNENSAWGDNEDAFNLSFNNVLSPVSNPSSINGGSLEFSIEVTGTNQITFYFDGDGDDEYEGSPSKPQNLEIATNLNGHPNLTWNANQEADFYRYHIFRNDAEIATTTSTTFQEYLYNTIRK
jgi:M6 family metalloprotease-like protein